MMTPDEVQRVRMELAAILAGVAARLDERVLAGLVGQLAAGDGWLVIRDCVELFLRLSPEHRSRMRMALAQPALPAAPATPKPLPS